MLGLRDANDSLGYIKSAGGCENQSARSFSSPAGKISVKSFIGDKIIELTQDNLWLSISGVSL